jgi:putative transposase
MPRMARILVPDMPHHIVQRGHNRAVVFFEDRDYLYYLDTLREWKAEFDVRVYAYCLMTNHVHLVLRPGPDTSGIAKLMKRLAARQTRRVNRLEKRSGTLWESRYRSSPIETDTYLLACTRYVELNPVRAGMVARPGDYRWSSYGAKVGGVSEGLVDFDECYLALAPDARARRNAYQSLVSAGVSDDEKGVIERSIQRGQLTGTHRFVDQLEVRMGVRVATRGPGRPGNPAK